MISLILSGGVGSRLWPLSREKLPKQFSPLFEKSLFTQTVERLQKLGEVQVCTSEGLRGLTEMAIRKQALKVSQAFYEPVGRNTAPAIALACQFSKLQGRSEEVMGVFPSDHWVEKEDVFSKALNLAIECATQGQIVTIGIKPSYAATGFGYIECLSEVFAEKEELKAFPVKAFQEKPDEKTAQSYVDAGRFFWNSGMFVFKVDTMVKAFEQHMPEMWKTMSSLKEDLSNLSEVYEQLPSQSIDYGIMEKVSTQVNIPCDVGWSDLGSWDDMAKISSEKSVASGAQVENVQSNNCYAHSDGQKTICFSNVDDLIVVDTADALLITRKNQSQSVKEVYSQLQKQGSSLVKDHSFEYRPWGQYQNIFEAQDFKAKVITVDPGQQLSYQSHTRRSEIWVTVEGVGQVVLDDKTIEVSKGVVVTVPVGAKHRMRNTGKQPLKFVEVQLGDYFGEDDITRYEDDYQRV